APPTMTGTLPPPPPRNPSATGAVQPPPQLQAMLPPTATTKDEYDLAYGYLLRKDYALAEESFRAFMRRHPGDRLAPQANYWLGESLFQRQSYRDAAESFLTVSTKYEKSGKAPDALLRLGQSLAALKEKEAACATFVEIGRKYPRASAGVRQGVEREQKRVGCWGGIPARILPCTSLPWSPRGSTRQSISSIGISRCIRWMRGSSPRMTTMARVRPITLTEAATLFADLKICTAVVLAVSGGPDSTALAVLAARWRARLRRGP